MDVCTSLFRRLITPKFKMFAPVWRFLMEKDKKSIKNNWRKIFKRFVGIPRSTENKIVDVVAGDILVNLDSTSKTLNYRCWSRK